MALIVTKVATHSLLHFNSITRNVVCYSKGVTSACVLCQHCLFIYLLVYFPREKGKEVANSLAGLIAEQCQNLNCPTVWQVGTDNL